MERIYLNNFNDSIAAILTQAYYSAKKPNQLTEDELIETYYNLRDKLEQKGKERRKKRPNGFTFLH